MKVYLVGGAVRDKLLGLPYKDKDWVVVGATEEQMLSRGYTKITASFPVFLDPKTKEEYALARAEKKVSKGYHGFETSFSKYTTLEDDLKRRDLTINSMAIDTDNNIIDPFDGQQDIKDRVLRHTSEAFIEDPLRVIRLARFKAQLSAFDFSIALETKELVKKLVRTDELSFLTKERLHIEFIKALTNPKIFFETLNELDVLTKVFPTIKKLLSLIPNSVFLDNYNYTSANTNQKITLCFLKTPQDHIKLLKNELLLTNNQFKLLTATINIKQILEKQLTAPEVFSLIKNANLLRDKKLYKDSIDTYVKYKNITKSNQIEKNHKSLENIISSISNLNLQNIIANTPKSNLKTTLDNLYIDIIKKEFKL
ncbi:CCA tRNA nucleotidyltransferase [Francisella sp. 19X1-34]|uniref:CCA tRNA nucleotidyltransferase n=1 Tax=Francisella sp. 19X1-34 TaxID=3087177 RepID=UPI002E362763|nr:CCA tRNA nucleotidyltransferase [Francisella sp. 19X1-34]MED7788179.1 CCA tRNA nucleotidyltransferase [Francisella sp. 19X1-34]